TNDLAQVKHTMAERAARRRPRWAGEQGAADVADVLVERIRLAQAALDGDEAGARIALEADEEQARVEFARERVDTVGERVPAPQDARVGIGRWRGEADVRVGGDARRAVGCRGIQVDRVELALAAEWGAGGFAAAEDALLLVEAGAVPR